MDFFKGTIAAILLSLVLGYPYYTSFKLWVENQSLTKQLEDSFRNESLANKKTEDCRLVLAGGK